MQNQNNILAPGSWILVGLGLFLLSACSNPITPDSAAQVSGTTTTATASSANTDRVVVEYKGYQVKLKPGLDASVLDFKDTEIQAALSSTMQSRDIAGTPATVRLDDLVNLIKEVMRSETFPDLGKPSETTFSQIKADFPGLDTDGIKKHYPEIRKIYENQLKKLVLNKVVASGILNGTGSATRDYQYKDTKISSAEIAICLAYPDCAVTLPNVWADAYTLTDRAFPGHKEDTCNPADALRHVVLNVLLCKYAPGLKDRKLQWAADFTEAHEMGNCYKPMESEMDLHNNDWGRYLYGQCTQIRSWLIFETGVYNEPSDDFVVAYTKWAVLYTGLYIPKLIYTPNVTISCINSFPRPSLVYIDPFGATQ